METDNRAGGGRGTGAVSGGQMNLFMKEAAPQSNAGVPAPAEPRAGGGSDQRSGTAPPLPAPATCPVCKQEKTLQWVNPGNLGPNTEICRDCLPKLFEQYGYREPGYRIVDESTVEIFSATTGWETIKTHWVKEFVRGIFANALFPLCVCLEHPEIGERNRQRNRFALDHKVYGITWACARLLSLKARVPIPQDLERQALEVNGR